ncbi:wings apart-like protein regulation of heterochromatin-domain-containing protein [Amylocarpus encephaloides]|uniref:Wings apart-like protein regulation of heterochromatin-domain-containing protein n=1 Tax=Amylocarpus encephaloides TaxID=45428 RepID=A0A9P7YH48_9HELO|nr:wings apart-like protein regulation of heterochromatin-domain-containing protein [Amylocarpus encephaloides]
MEADIYNVPASDEKKGRVNIKQVRKARPKPVADRIPKPPSPRLPVPKRGDIYEVPSSDDENGSGTNIRQVRKAQSKPAMDRASRKPSPKQIQEVISTNVGEVPSRKRVKLSPSPRSSSKTQVPDGSFRKGVQKATARKELHKVYGMGGTPVMAARPKPKVQQNETRSQTLPRTLSPPQFAEKQSNRRTPMSNDTDMMDVDSQPSHIPPKGLKMWEGVLNASMQPPSSAQRRKPKIAQLQNFQEDDNDLEGSGAAIRSVHELRQAGANSRFLDEIEDLLDRIGSPGSSQSTMRRSGLLDMATQLKDKGFVRQFRANHVEERLFVHLGQETDVIAGVLLVSMLTTVLLDGCVPPFVVQLRRQGIARLLIRLLQVQSSIVLVAKERKNNATKAVQKLIEGHHEYLMQLGLWEELQPRSISPRTIALKCIEVMVRQTREAGSANEIFSKELTTNLFTVLKNASNENAWGLPQSNLAIEFYLALSALESHSLTARTVSDESVWLIEYLPTIADALHSALIRPIESFGILQVLILRLTLNVTNNNPQASTVFARESLMSSMGKTVVAKFKQISGFMTEEDLSVSLDHLTLVLGAMINFAAWSPDARTCLDSLAGGEDDPLDTMIQTYTDNQDKMSEASSVEEIQKNVAFAYLSVLLGYLSLLPSVAQRVKTHQSSHSLAPVIASIQEFIGYHKAVDEQAVDEAGNTPQSKLTEQLQGLVSNLVASSAI